MNMSLTTAALLALLGLCAAQDSYADADADAEDEHYLRKRARPHEHEHGLAHRLGAANSFNYHKCCLETGDYFCCDLVRASVPVPVPEQESEEDDVDVDGPLGFLRVGLPRQRQRPLDVELELELQDLLDAPREREAHWKSRRIDKKFQFH